MLACRFDHKIKGMGIYCYVLPASGVEASDALKKELSQVVRQQIGAFAAPDVIHWVPGGWPAQCCGALQHQSCCTGCQMGGPA